MINPLALMSALAIGGGVIRKAALTKYEAIFSDKSKKYGVDKNLLKALVKVESDFISSALGDTGHELGPSRGLGQILWHTAQLLGIENPDDLFDPEINIDCMGRLLHESSRLYDTTTDIISAYNMGSVKKDEMGRYKNNKYVMKVYSYYIWYSVSELFSWMDPVLS